VSFSGLSTISFPALNLGAVDGQMSYAATQTNVDKLFLFNHALSTAEIDQIVATGSVPEPASCVALGLACAAFLRQRRRGNIEEK
jgi:hypothetical protein